jgi:hypothetical protein
MQYTPRGTATGERQRMSENAETWVVYLMTVRGDQVPRTAVCEQSEWDAMELARPGFHTLIQSGIATETEAEKLARGTSGDRPAKHKAR